MGFQALKTWLSIIQLALLQQYSSITGKFQPGIQSQSDQPCFSQSSLSSMFTERTRTAAHKEQVQ